MIEIDASILGATRSPPSVPKAEATRSSSSFEHAASSPPTVLSILEIHNLDPSKDPSQGAYRSKLKDSGRKLTDLETWGCYSCGGGKNAKMAAWLTRKAVVLISNDLGEILGNWGTFSTMNGGDF